MRSYEHLSLEERESLSEKIGEGKSVRQIGREMGRAPSTISRELKRNWSKVKDRYHPWRATVLYLWRRKKSVRKPRLGDEALLTFVKKGLDKGWSPEIIVQRWKRKHPCAQLSHNTLYRALKQRRLPAPYSANTHLRRHGQRQNIRGFQSIHPDHTIHDRPAVIEQRIRLGDLEGDTLYGGIGKGCAVTLIDRTSRFLYSTLVQSREKQVIERAFEVALKGVSVASITLDNGSEFAAHREIAKTHHTTIYFADPHSPWQRGSNENVNGLLRFFYPKGTNFKNVTEEDFQAVITLINDRPRKCLGWLSPLEFLNASCCT